jgi:hypothetical protein
MKRKIIKQLLILFFVFLFFSVSKAQAAYFKFNVNQVNVAAGGEFDLQLIVDPEGEEITSVDAYIQFDQNLIEGISVTDGSYFPTVTNNISSTTIYVAGLVDDPASPKTGTGTVATIKFKAKTNGTAAISFNCDTSKIVKNDINSTNIISCGKNESAQVIIGQGSTGNQTASNNSSTTNGELPRTGLFDNTGKLFLSGALLFFAGLLSRVLFKF